MKKAMALTSEWLEWANLPQTSQGFALISLRDMEASSQETRKSEYAGFHAVPRAFRCQT
jgi:hypothetical protein